MKIQIFIFSVLLYILNTVSILSFPKVENGILNLRDTSFESTDIISLEGKWDFHWGEFTPPDNWNKSKNEWIQVPHNWALLNYPRFGYATYHAKIFLPVTHSNTFEKLKNTNHSNLNGMISRYSLILTDIGTAYQLFINNKLVAESGKIGIDAQSSEPFLKHKTIPLFLDSFEDEIDIVVHVSNFDHSMSGIYNSIKLATTEAANSQAKRILIIDLIVFSSLAIMGIYHLGLFFSRTKDLSPLHFGIFCILISIRTISINERMILDLFPELGFRLNHKIEYFTFYFGGFVFLQFISSLFPDESKRIIHQFFITVTGIASIVVLLFPLDVYSKTLLYMQILIFLEILYVLYMLFLALARKRFGSITFLVGFIFFATALINDILKGAGLIFTPYLASYGLMSFVFFQSLILSRRFAGGLQKAEDLGSELKSKTEDLEKTASELKQLTENLEFMIQDRTRELTKAKSELEVINHFTNLINSLSSLNDIFIEISKYMKSKYQIQTTWLFLPDKKEEFLFTYKVYSYKRMPDDKYQYMLSKRVPIDNKGGILALTFMRKKPLYLPKIKKLEFEVDRELTSTLNVNSLLDIPLVVRGKSIGIFGFSNMEEKLILSKSDINTISNLCLQIAGVIETTHLLSDVQKARNQTDDLNQLLKSLNEELNLKVIMQKVFSYVRDNFGIQHYGLQYVTEDGNSLQLVDVSFPDHISEEDRNTILKNKIPIKNTKLGAHALVINAKRPFYLPKLKQRNITNEEAFVIEKYMMKSFLMIPLILENDPIGILDFTNSEVMNLKQDDLTRISILGEQLAGIIYNARLYASVEEARASEKKAFEDLKESQNKLIQSEKMAALGNLIAGVAHEINTPIGAIKASSENLKMSLEDILRSSPLVIRELDKEIMDLIIELVLSPRSTQILSTKEERKEKELSEQFKNNKILKSEEISSILVEMRIYSIDPKFDILWNHPRLSEILKLMSGFSSLRSISSTISTSVDKTSKIVNALKSYAGGDSIISMKKADIIPGIESVLVIYQNYINQGIQLKKELNPLPPINCSPDELNQVWTNLIFNAIQAMKNQGELVVRTELVNPEKVRISITDSGPGIPVEIQEKIFEPFFTTKIAGEGSGLGLHISKEIINKHNGTITFNSKPGKTEFLIELPV